MMSDSEAWPRSVLLSGQEQTVLNGWGDVMFRLMSSVVRCSTDLG